MKNNLNNTYPIEEKAIELKIKAIIQSYNRRLIKNEMIIKKVTRNL
jgi:hypothetical protein